MCMAVKRSGSDDAEYGLAVREVDRRERPDVVAVHLNVDRFLGVELDPLDVVVASEVWRFGVALCE